MNFWEKIELFDRGAMINETVFDRELNRRAKELKMEFEINYNPDDPVNQDLHMADRLFQAAVNLFVELGVYCLDTRKIGKFSKEEVLKSMEHAPDSVSFGQGEQKRTLVHRNVGDREPPFCSPNPVGTPVREELFEEILNSYASIPDADTFSGPSLLSLYGQPVRSGTPLEVEAAIWNIQRIDQARKKAGRPDMGSHNFISCAEKTDAIIASTMGDFGARKSDGLLNGAIAELKVDFERLKKVAYLRKSGHVIGGLYGPLMGGYAGGPEETAITLVAHHFLGLMAFEAIWHDSFPIHIHHVCNTDSSLLWVVSISGQALARNTHLPIMSCCFASAGPCTPMVFDELCAHSVTAVVSGYNINPMAPARNKYPERCSGWEAKSCCEIGHAVANLQPDLKEVNRFVKELVKGYEKKIPNAPIGRTFEECYDVDRMTPKPEYIKLYEEAKKRWEKLGFSP